MAVATQVPGPLSPVKSLQFRSISDTIGVLVLSGLPSQQAGYPPMPDSSSQTPGSGAWNHARHRDLCEEVRVRDHVWLSGTRLKNAIVCSPHDGHAFSVTDDSAMVF